jgi:23S rRNA G2445 N2-methylase RlmL
MRFLLPGYYAFRMEFHRPLLDPMCGSEQFPSRAVLMACKIPPGKFRDFFGFSRWKDFDNLFI